MSRHRNPLRYLPWLARDVARGPGLLFALGSLVVAAILWRIAERTGDIPDVALVQVFTLRAVALIMVLIATGGMVSTDIHQGYYRAWFSKPIAPWWYYLQRWLLGGAVVLAMPLVYGACLAAFLGAGHGVNGALLAQLALGYLLIGSAVFLASTVTRWDWLAIFILSFAQASIKQVIDSPIEVPAAVRLAYRVLPPFHLVEFGGPTLSGGPLWHLLGYGGGMLALAIVVLLLRPLGSGGRA